MTAVEEVAGQVGVQAACRVLGVARATLYQHRGAGEPATEPGRRASSPRALSAEERQHVLDLLHNDRFLDASPAEVYATLLDENTYLCSERTMYRLLAHQGESRERRNQLRHPLYSKPELLATAPNQVWSWDITKLRGPAKWVHHYLYVILDIFSRYVVGWMLAEREAATLAEQLIAETLERFSIPPGQLTLHADRGPSMRAKPVAWLLADLGVTRTHTRPYTSSDNPYSEAQFKTLKYHPSFPGRFDSFEHARGFCRSFFLWYNHEHRHSGLALMPPEVVHFGLTEQVLQHRTEVLNAAYQAHPQRFCRPPRPKQPPAQAWINPPREAVEHDDFPELDAPRVSNH